MQLKRVKSSMIYAAGYDAVCERMEVVFFNGVYRYYDVPPSIYEGLLAAESKGKFMHAHVLGRYPYRLLQGVVESTELLAAASVDEDEEDALPDAPRS